MADILSDAIFQVIEQRGTSLLIDKALTYKFFVCVCWRKSRVWSSFTWEIRYPFFCNLLNYNGPVNDILTIIYIAASLLKSKRWNELFMLREHQLGNFLINYFLVISCKGTSMYYVSVFWAFLTPPHGFS